jgi:hypothetical protein
VHAGRGILRAGEKRDNQKHGETRKSHGSTFRKAAQHNTMTDYPGGTAAVPPAGASGVP